MPAQRDRDILLPQEPARLEVLSRLRSMLRTLRRFVRSPASQGLPEVGAADLWAAFEYLTGEYEATGALHEDLTDTLAAKFALQAGRARFDLQCRLAAVLADRSTVRFHVGLRLATHLPVPQARTALLQMLTQPDLARWTPQPTTAVPGGNGSHLHDLDLRPAVIAALGQLRDPSLLGLFHRLLEKLAAVPAGQGNVIAAVQWSLMNLAPGSRNEPVPAEILSTSSRNGQEPPAAPAARSPAADGTSTAEALRVVAAFRDWPAASKPGPRDRGDPAGNGRVDNSQGPGAGSSERNELLSGF
jgi:hypothetical protein